MKQKTLFEKIGVQYEERDGLLYPLIALDIKEDDANVGKYGRMWMQYLKSEYPQRYRSLLRFGELNQKAAEVNEVMTKDSWVRLMNCLRILKRNGCKSISRGIKILLRKCIS